MAREKPYVNREIDEKFKNLLDHTIVFEKDMRESNSRIETSMEIGFAGTHERQDKTNGTVRWTVKMIYLSMGFCACVTILILPFLWSLISSGSLR